MEKEKIIEIVKNAVVEHCDGTWGGSKNYILYEMHGGEVIKFAQEIGERIWKELENVS